MTTSSKAAYAVALCAMISAPTIAGAQTPVPHHPAKAPATTPIAKPVVANTAWKASGVASTQAPKPPVVTAVAPKSPVPSANRSIIFVGGKPQAGGNAALNPQPIPPGHGGPGDPQR